MCVSTLICTVSLKQLYVLPAHRLGFRVQGSGSRVQGSGSRVQGPGFRVQGSGFRGWHHIPLADHSEEEALEEARLLERVPARQQVSMPVSNARQQVSKPVRKPTRQQVSIPVSNLSKRIMARKKRSRKLDSSSAYLPVSKSGISYRRALAVLR